MQSQVVFYVDMQGKGKGPLPLHSIPKTNNNSKTKSNNKTKTKNKIKVVYTEDLTHPRRQFVAFRSLIDMAAKTMTKTLVNRISSRTERL
jgi:hypothetical protein